MDNWEAETLNISGIVDDSIVDGPGLRYTIFVQGCPHGCPECHNPQTHSFEENKRVTLGQLMSEIKENPLLYGVTFSGGEPFCQPGPLAILGQQIKKAGMHLMCYSGYTYEQLLTDHLRNKGSHWPGPLPLPLVHFYRYAHCMSS